MAFGSAGERREDLSDESDGGPASVDAKPPRVDTAFKADTEMAELRGAKRPGAS